MTMTASTIARSIDHTLLRPEATPKDVDRLCDEAVEYGFAGVCVQPIFVSRAARRFEAILPHAGASPRPRVITVSGFPLGANLTATKADEARRGMGDGATEIDMVAPLGALFACDATAVRRDIEAVAAVVHRDGGDGILKVILETAALSKDQIVLGCRCCAEGEADFVKTSTGFHPAGGATVEHVRLLHRCAAPLGVKAAGGIRTAAQAVAMLEAGARRLGTSAGVAIVKELGSAAD